MPLVQRAGGHHVGVTGEAEQRALGAAACPQVGGVFKHHGFDDEAEASEALRHQGLAPLIQGGN
ncbi:hypothetical protein D3C79_1060200 [compost metagenome]